MRIGFDIDGVLGEFEQHFLEWFNLPRHSATSWDDERFTKNMHKIKNSSEFFLSMPTIFDSSELLIQPCMYVTARDIDSKVTKEWLDKNGFPSAPVYTVGRNKSKLEVLKGNVDFFVDDAIHNYEHLNENGVNCFLITRSHNLGYDAGDRRFENLLDLQEKLLSDAGFFSSVFSYDFKSGI